MFLVSFILVSQKRMCLRGTRMDTRRWQRSRSQVRQRQCLWVCSLVEVTAACSSIAVVLIASIAHSQGDRAPGRPRSTGVHDRRPSVPTKSICIARAFYAYTSLGRHSSERIRRLIAQDAALARKAGDASEFENTLVSIVKMAYKLTTARAARSQTDIMGGTLWEARSSSTTISAERLNPRPEIPNGLYLRTVVCVKWPQSELDRQFWLCRCKKQVGFFE